MITRDSLEQKLVALRAQKDQYLANANAAQGAILVVEQLIAELLAEEVAQPKVE